MSVPNGKDITDTGERVNDLWIVGILGCGAGAAIGAPLMMRRTAAGAGWTTERLAGGWLLGSAVAMLLVAVRHGGLLPPGVDDAVEHLTNALNLVAWPFLVTIVRRIAGAPAAWPRRLDDHLLLPAIYIAVVVSLGLSGIPFLWLMPVGVVCVAVIASIWRTTRASPDADVRRAVSVAFALAAVFLVAQAVRSAAPRVTGLREIVPFVMTLWYFAAAFALLRQRLLAVPAGVAAAEAATPPSYAKSGLTTERALELVDAMDTGMRNESWYRETDLSLSGLAERLGVSPQVVSQVLNQQRRQSLTEYLTAWRVSDARCRLLDPAQDCYAVAGVARQSGFASRSAFYKAFREAEGVTPTEFRRKR